MVKANLAAASLRILDGGQAGLYAAGLVIKKEAIMLTPWDTGNLAGSAYVRKESGTFGEVVEVGYDAGYALAVHETNKNYRVGQWKFLQTAVDDNRGRIMDIIKAYARV